MTPAVGRLSAGDYIRLAMRIIYSVRVVENDRRRRQEFTHESHFESQVTRDRYETNTSAVPRE